MKRRMLLIAMLLAYGGASTRSTAQELVVDSFDRMGQMTFSALPDASNHNYRIEWAPNSSGPWSSFSSAGRFWLDTIQAQAGSVVTSSVPTLYRVVKTPGDYLVINVSGGPAATSYPVTYYRTIADVPGGASSNAYKTTNILMRLIPKGTFTMGSPSGELGREGDEKQHPVILTRDFYIGVFEVTQRQWERVMGNWPSYLDDASTRDARSVEQVSYGDIRGNSVGSEWPASGNVDAESFLGKLRAKTGLAGLDLPTEAEWEYACRAGTTTALNSGKNLTGFDACPNMSEVGRYWHNGGMVSMPKVGSYLSNAWGLYDMHGYVMEWCRDWYTASPPEGVDPAGAPSGSYRVLRGGCWNDGARWCRSAYRNYNASPVFGDINFGFRLSLSLQ